MQCLTYIHWKTHCLVCIAMETKSIHGFYKLDTINLQRVSINHRYYQFYINPVYHQPIVQSSTFRLSCFTCQVNYQRCLLWAEQWSRILTDPSQDLQGCRNRGGREGHRGQPPPPSLQQTVVNKLLSLCCLHMMPPVTPCTSCQHDRKAGRQAKALLYSTPSKLFENHFRLLSRRYLTCTSEVLWTQLHVHK